VNELLRQLDPSLATAELGLLLVIFAAVVLIVVGGVGALGSRNPLARLQDAAAGPSAASQASLRIANNGSFFARLLEPLRRSAMPKDDDKRSAVRARLIQAGYSAPTAAGTYYAARVVLAIALPPLATALAPLAIGDADPGWLAVTAVAAAVVGLYLPALWVKQRIETRQLAVREGFPDALDMLLVCVEAGLSLAAALSRMAGEIGRAHPVIGEQFNLVALEMQAGKSRERALRNLGERIGIEEVNSLVTILLQSEALGTSIAQSLRIHADHMRKRRLLRAEESANKLPVKIALPLGLFILPCLMLVIMTPIAIKIVRVLLPSAAGG